MRYASIDIGTNTLRLLIADAEKGAAVRPVLYDRKITRLGGGYTEDKGISPEAAARSIKALEEFKRSIDELKPEKVVAVATSVVRRAVNGRSFTDEVRRLTGIEISIIDGDKEAGFAVAGVLSVVDGADRGKKLIIDIGGGSTEFILTEGRKALGAWSMELGVVHLTEKFVASDPPSPLELKAMEDEIRKVIDELIWKMEFEGAKPHEFAEKHGGEIIGTAGTVTTLAALEQNLEKYDRERINNYILRREGIRDEYRRIACMTLKERGEFLRLEKGREDLILAGAAITLNAMEHFGFHTMRVSDAGLLEGIIMKEIGA